MSTYRAGAFLHVAPALLYIGVVFYLGSIAVDPLVGVDFDFKDKVMHALAFGGMQLTHARAFSFLWPEWPRRRVALWSGLSAASFGGLLELWQAALPHRSADFWDFIADAVGAFVAAFVWERVLAPRVEAS